MPALYQPDSVSWRVNRESVVLLAGGRALLMQLAHPAVAAGVAEHSDFQRHPIARLLRTLGLSLALTFGTEEQTHEAARAINRVHQRVQGRGYTARDPALLLWVQATLIDSALTAYGTFVRPLSAAERAAYVEEGKAVGRLLGIPEQIYPTGLSAFEDYVRSMLEGPDLVVDARARALAAAVLRPPVRIVPGLVWLPTEAITAGLLPHRLREDFGIAWDTPRRFFFSSVTWALPRLLPVVPAPLRILPQARVAGSVR